MRTLFIISDLHLGGRPHDLHRDGALLPGYQFNHAYPALIAFIDWVGRQGDAAGNIELVIDGDIVDFLADDDYPGGAQAWTADEDLAAAKLDLIATRTRGADGRGVFETMRDFLAGGNRLTILLGNHDIELALPAVRRRLFALLGGERPGLTFIYDGEAYQTGRVLVEHGNRYDRWNRIDHDALRQERSMRSRRLPIDEARRGERYFVPPAGTHMVIDVINRLKSRYRFIDLLKPETGAVVPLLFALEPSSGKYLNGVINAYLSMPQYFGGGMLGPGEPLSPGLLNTELAVNPTLEQVLTEELGLRDAELFIGPYHAAKPRQPAAAAGNLGIGDDARTHTAEAHAWLGEWQAVAADGIAALARRSIGAIDEWRWRQLHLALRRVVRRDRSFDLRHEEDAYLDAAKAIVRGGEIDVVVNGHTHLPKLVPIGCTERPCWYLNTGTWCDVLRLPGDIGGEFEEAKPALERFVAALDANALQPYVKRYLSYVEIRLDGDRVAGTPRLHAYCGPGRERAAALTEYPAAPAGPAANTRGCDEKPVGKTV